MVRWLHARIRTRLEVIRIHLNLLVQIEVNKSVLIEVYKSARASLLPKPRSMRDGMPDAKQDFKSKEESESS